MKNVSKETARSLIREGWAPFFFSENGHFIQLPISSNEIRGTGRLLATEYVDFDTLTQQLNDGETLYHLTLIDGMEVAQPLTESWLNHPIYYEKAPLIGYYAIEGEKRYKEVTVDVYQAMTDIY